MRVCPVNRFVGSGKRDLPYETSPEEQRQWDEFQMGRWAEAYVAGVDGDAVAAREELHEAMAWNPDWDGALYSHAFAAEDRRFVDEIFTWVVRCRDVFWAQRGRGFGGQAMAFFNLLTCDYHATGLQGLLDNALRVADLWEWYSPAVLCFVFGREPNDANPALMNRHPYASHYGGIDALRAHMALLQSVCLEHHLMRVDQYQRPYADPFPTYSPCTADFVREHHLFEENPSALLFVNNLLVFVERAKALLLNHAEAFTRNEDDAALVHTLQRYMPYTQEGGLARLFQDAERLLLHVYNGAAARRYVLELANPALMRRFGSVARVLRRIRKTRRLIFSE